MSKLIAAIPLEDVERVAILFGGGRSLEQVKGDADYILNGGFYDMATGRPVGHLKADGVVWAAEQWTSWGFAWNDGVDMAMEGLPYSAVKNYLSGVPLLTPWDGPNDPLGCNPEVGGSRPRTAMALTGDKLLLYCADSPSTPEQLREELYRLGAETAVMLDGGGSSQCDFMGQTIESARRVHNYIAVWLKTDKKQEGEKVMSKKVVLDPGHGVETAGKRSPDGTYLEHEFALDMAKRLRKLLERHGVEVTLTREDEHDLSNTERASLSNRVGPDLFVSLHSNAAGSGANWMSPRGYGIHTSVADDTAGRNIAARAILARAKAAGVHLWGGGLHHARFTVLTKTAAPAVLIEHLFHDNREDVALLKDGAYRDMLAEVDAKGVLDYLGIAWEEEAVEGPQQAVEGAKCPHCGGALKIEKG